MTYLAVLANAFEPTLKELIRINIFILIIILGIAIIIYKIKKGN